ncbi:hypothetical protein [Clostridium sp. C8-1-8]|uniref:hypothetical protein n=1 Tax=Clostridium sp. C8-1-8 TaxID=2698831 RepID=UPI001370FEEE|nr:hypothetical protein [Clostridium sp. C8-1-8]
MCYKFEIDNTNYQDYSSGRVLYNQHGTTAFPVRLASEIFQRCNKILREKGLHENYSIYDPCCGGTYLLTSIGFLHGKHISEIYASDINKNVITLAKKNLSLLSISGLNKRIEQIYAMIHDFGKDSHFEALESSSKLMNIICNRNNMIKTECFVEDITDCYNENLSGINIVISDLPYGNMVSWENNKNNNDSINKLLDNLLPKLSSNSVVALITKKKVPINHCSYIRLERFTIGKRQITILSPR